MPTSLLFVTMLALAAPFSAGCANAHRNPASPSQTGGATTFGPAEIAGTWTLVSMTLVGEEEQAVPAGAPYALTFADGRASAQADCNTCGGSLVIDGQGVTIGPQLACTRAACRTMAFESAYVKILSGESAARVDGASLVLTSTRGVLRFKR